MALDAPFTNWKQGCFQTVSGRRQLLQRAQKRFIVLKTAVGHGRISVIFLTLYCVSEALVKLQKAIRMGSPILMGCPTGVTCISLVPAVAKQLQRLLLPSNCCSSCTETLLTEIFEQASPLSKKAHVGARTEWGRGWWNRAQLILTDRIKLEREMGLVVAAHSKS